MRSSSEHELEGLVTGMARSSTNFVDRVSSKKLAHPDTDRDPPACSTCTPLWFGRQEHSDEKDAGSK
jgi:hypothetical protein